MFAVLNTGGKQYKVSQGDLIEVEKLESDVGDTVTLNQVLMVGEGERLRFGLGKGLKSLGINFL